MENVFPTFLVIGAQRCGTSALHYKLLSHPQICLSSIRKELDFFITMKRHGTPFEEYAKLFPNYQGEPAVGDISPKYLYYHEFTAELIASYLPDARIVIILRHPIERAYSAYRYALKTGREWMSFQKAIERPPSGQALWDYRLTSTYAPAVNSYKSKCSNVEVFLFEELTRNDAAIMDRLYRHLGVEAAPLKHELVRYQKNAGDYPLFPLLNRSWGYISWQVADRKGLRRALKFLRHKQVRFPSTNHIPPLDPKFYNDLLKEFEPDIRETSRLIGRDLSDWLVPMDSRASATHSP